MRWYEAVILGILQGLSEFLPISSSGHLAIAQELFGVGLDSSQRLGFSVLLHLSTLLAVVLVYRAEVWTLVKGALGLLFKLFSGRIRAFGLEPCERLALCCCISTLVLLPCALIGDFLKNLSSSMLVVGVCLMLNSVLLWFSDTLGKQSKDLSCMSFKDALWVGVCQLFALMPGISRSGSTVTGMLFRDFNRECAVKYSFIMSIPTILGACVFEIPEMFSDDLSRSQLLIYLQGALFAAITAILAMKLLCLISKKANFRIFSYYCALLGALTVLGALL